jgi:hypothetical protein
MISTYSQRLCDSFLRIAGASAANNRISRIEFLSVTARWIPHAAFFILLALIATLPAAAQQTKDQKKAEAMLRTVHGLVENKDEDPLSASVVYLLNVKTQAVRTSFADEKGLYRFSGLDPNVDYEIHAEHDDLTSSTRTISSFDSRRDIEVNLKVTRKKKP